MKEKFYLFTMCTSIFWGTCAYSKTCLPSETLANIQPGSDLPDGWEWKNKPRSLQHLVFQEMRIYETGKPAECDYAYKGKNETVLTLQNPRVRLDRNPHNVSYGFSRDIITQPIPGGGGIRCGNNNVRGCTYGEARPQPLPKETIQAKPKPQTETQTQNQSEIRPKPKQRQPIPRPAPVPVPNPAPSAPKPAPPKPKPAPPAPAQKIKPALPPPAPKPAPPPPAPKPAPPPPAPKPAPPPPPPKPAPPPPPPPKPAPPPPPPPPKPAPPPPAK